jgi:hypothetical protein
MSRAPTGRVLRFRGVAGAFKSLLPLDALEPAQQQANVFRQLFLHDVAGCLTQGLADFVEEDHVGQLWVFWPKAHAD